MSSCNVVLPLPGAPEKACSSSAFHCCSHACSKVVWASSRPFNSLSREQRSDIRPVRAWLGAHRCGFLWGLPGGGARASSYRHGVRLLDQAREFVEPLSFSGPNLPSLTGGSGVVLATSAAPKGTLPWPRLVQAWVFRRPTRLWNLASWTLVEAVPPDSDLGVLSRGGAVTNDAGARPVGAREDEPPTPARGGVCWVF